MEVEATLSLAPIQILVAEDEPLIALSLCDMLEMEGYEVTIACDGAEALTEALRIGPGLGALLTDLNMPKMSGEELIQEVRSRLPLLPILVMTGAAPPGGLDELRRGGDGREPFALLHKPVSYDTLMDTLRRALQSPCLPL